MSYSFTVQAGSKAEAKEQVTTELSKLVEQQPDHKADREQALVAAQSFIDILPDDNEKDIAVRVAGHLSSTGTDASAGITSASVSVSAELVTKNSR